MLWEALGLLISKERHSRNRFRSFFSLEKCVSLVHVVAIVAYARVFAMRSGGQYSTCPSVHFPLCWEYNII